MNENIHERILNELDNLIIETKLHVEKLINFRSEYLEIIWPLIFSFKLLNKNYFSIVACRKSQMSIIRLFDPEILKIIDELEVNKFADENQINTKGKALHKQYFTTKMQ